MMKKSLLLLSLLFYTLPCFSSNFIVVGGGFSGAIEAYFEYFEAKQSLDGKQKDKPLRITVYDKNEDLTKTTAYNIFPSLTYDEIVSVVPKGPQLVKALNILFSLPGGIRIDDVRGIIGTEITKQFVSSVQKYSLDESEDNNRTQALLKMGKMSMNLWQKFYDEADSELQKILVESNLNLCKDPSSTSRVLRDGYRIDLIYNVANAYDRAAGMKQTYEELGADHCAILTPAEVIALDPFLTDFCKQNSTLDASGALQWNNDAVALWRPGGCIDASTFLPKFYDYMTKVMGTYTDAHGVKHNNFQIHYGKHVVKLQFAATGKQKQSKITGLEFADGSTVSHENAEYVFCPGEAIGTLKGLGLQEPTYAGFAGASLRLDIDIPADQIAASAKFNHCMEVHQEGVVLAWQARAKGNKIFIGVAGTKSFYSDQRPNKDQDFAKNRNLLQLNMVNNVLPQYISWALGYDTTGKTLTQSDLELLESKKIATRWAGVRAVAYDGFPTLGNVYHDNQKVLNARCTTHLGSGGVSFGPAAVAISRSVMNNTYNSNELVQQILRYANSTRTA